MRIATWNINSIRVRSQQVVDFIRKYKIDVLLLQEIKCQNELFPYSIFSEYNCAVFGQRAYNGVAIISKFPVDDIHLGNTIFKEDTSTRYIDALINGYRIICVYIPNGQMVGTPYYFYKLEFLDILTKHLSGMLSSNRIIVGGDFNITRSDLDVWNPKLWQGKNCCSDAERTRFQSLINLGFKDTPREESGNREIFTWWDYRNNSFNRDHGLRLDYLLTTSDIKVFSWQRCLEQRKLSQPSDHIPLLIDI